jgi:hypothetical protein
VRFATLERNLTLQPCVLGSVSGHQNAPTGDEISLGGDSNVAPKAGMGRSRMFDADEAMSARHGQTRPQSLNEIAMTRAEMHANTADLKEHLSNASALMSCSSTTSQLQMADLMNLVTQVSSKLDSIVPPPHPDACHLGTLSNLANAFGAILWLS